MGKRARSNEAEAEAPPPATEVVEHAAFGVFLWIELSVILSQRVLDRIQQCSMQLFVLDDASDRLERVEQLGKELERTWLAARTIIPADEWSRCNSAVQVYMSRFMADLRAIVVAAKPRDVLALCRAIQRLLEESGFTEGENSCLDHYVADYRQQHELSCYSYSERASMAMPLLARYDGDKRTEAEHSRPRSGFMVVLPRVHDQPEINTQIQLIEPRKRRPPLDEYRIFSHPKKAATYGVEDFIVEEELMHRAYATLTMHMDVFGSFAQISPFCRFVLWSVVDRDDAVFRQLLHAQTNTEAMRQKMTEVRVLLDEKKRRFESCRASARTAAHHIGWFAVSAQWRDQIVSKWSEVEEGDWCCMCEVARLGGSAIFPNYSYSAAVSSMALNVIKKLDRCHKPSPPVLEVVERVLMPLLRGEAPPAAPDAISESGSFDRYVRRIHALASSKRLDVKTEVSSSALGPSSSSSSSGASTHLHTLILPSVVFPLQCLAELLELCSVALHSAVGIESFAKSFLATSWQDEDAILAYLIKKEPANTAIAPLAVLPKLYKDLLTGVELMGKDRLLPLVLAANRSTVSSHLLSRNTKDYVYWKALSMNLAEKDRYDDLVWLMVVPLSATSSLARPRREEPNLHLHYTTSTVERASKVWAEELRELIEAEKEVELFTTPAA